MAPSDLRCCEQQVGPFAFGQLSKVCQVLQTHHAVTSHRPIRHQSPPWICASQGGAIRSHAANPLSFQVANHRWTWSGPTFALAIEWGLHTFLEGVLLGTPLAVIAPEDDDLARLEGTVLMFKC